MNQAGQITGLSEAGKLGSAASILIVDDNSTNRIMLARYVNRLGHKSTLAENGREALDKMKGEQFDLVLLDIEMPELNGYEVLAQLKTQERWRDIPVIMISAVEELESVVKCIELGAEDYLPKPFNPILLRARITASLSRKGWHDQEQAYLQAIQAEQLRSEALLLNILPRAVAEQLKAGLKTVAQSYEEATVLFADIEGFTPFASRIPAQELVEVLNQLFTSFDELVEYHGLEKIKTIGDAYMAVAGVPEPCANHAQRAADLALAMQEAIRHFSFGPEGERLGLRIGLHSGPVIAGVIGSSKFSYDLWGDTVNTASRMESSGEKGRIQLSANTYTYLVSDYHCEPRGKIAVKGKGELETYWLLGADPILL